jgi:hypothetical protein
MNPARPWVSYFCCLPFLLFKLSDLRGLFGLVVKFVFVFPFLLCLPLCPPRPLREVAFFRYRPAVSKNACNSRANRSGSSSGI